jgi:hypothetical protein
MTDIGVELEGLAVRMLDPFYLPMRADFTALFGTSSEDSEADRKWQTYIRNKKIDQYEVLNREFVEALGGYLRERAQLFEEPPVILEIGSGNGRLAFFLNSYLSETETGIEIVATDSGDWGIETVCDVDQLPCEEALQKYEPQIVVCSWMPRGVDFTAAMRAQRSVSEYLLIGETETGCCGSDKLTWGVEIDNEGNIIANNPPYKAEGFSRNYVAEVRKHQMCRADNVNLFIHSETISFRREC